MYLVKVIPIIFIVLHGLDTSPGKASENPNTIFNNCHTFDCVYNEFLFLGFLLI